MQGEPTVNALPWEGIEKVTLHKELPAALGAALHGGVQSEARIEQHIGIHHHSDTVACIQQAGHNKHVDRESPEAYKQVIASSSYLIQRSEERRVGKECRSQR